MDGKHIKKKIMESHLSQKEVAEKMGVTPQTISSMLAGKNISSEVLEKLCRVIGTTMNKLYEGYKDDEFYEQTNSSIVNATNNIEQHEGDVIGRLLDVIQQKEAELKNKDRLIHNLYKENIRLAKGPKDQEEAV